MIANPIATFFPPYIYHIHFLYPDVQSFDTHCHDAPPPKFADYFTRFRVVDLRVLNTPIILD